MRAGVVLILQHNLSGTADRIFRSSQRFQKQDRWDELFVFGPEKPPERSPAAFGLVQMRWTEPNW